MSLKKNINEAAFKDKFKDRIENMGKEGMSSIMKKMDNYIPISKNDFQGDINECNIYLKLKLKLNLNLI
jgi:hypothetical protein